MIDDTTPADLTEVETLADGMLSDYITGKPVKDTPVERVRQRIAKAMIHEYGFDLVDLERDYTVAVEDDGRSRRRKVEIAIFQHKKPHTLEHLRRVILCRPEPKASKKAVTILRDHQQAEKDLRELKEIMEAVTPCMFGLWTNGLDVFFLHKNPSRFGSSFEPTTDWPTSDNTQGSLSVLSFTQLRQADEDMLRLAFRRCHNFIHGNEGMPKDAAFWQFLYLIFSKMYDERLAIEAKAARKEYERQFVAYPEEVYPPEQKDGRELLAAEREKIHHEAQARLKKRVEALFDKVKELYGPASPHPIFQGNETITLSQRALAFLVAELARYELSRTDIDAKGVAYQELVGTNLRGDRGQYFTPRGARRLVVEILDPKESERVFDPACGTGGFLKETLSHLLRTMKAVEGTAGRPDATEDFRSHQQRLEAYAKKNLFGADFDPFLVRATSMQILLAANTTGNIFHMDALAFPKGHLPGVEQAKRKVGALPLLDFGTIDVLMTNPPFGSDIPITDPLILEQYKDGLARKVVRENSRASEQGYERAVSPEVLFVERSVKFLKEGGRLGIVLPDGILGNPGDRHIREWILRNCWVLASVDLPVEIFIVEANVNIEAPAKTLACAHACVDAGLGT